LAPVDEILQLFEQIAKIPRCTGNEAGIREWLIDWAGQHGLVSQVDPAGNLVIRVPASAGAGDKPAVVLQAHMDMVCEKNPNVEHDFRRDAIQLVREGDWLRANGTTLGADNGIGIALALEAAQAKNISHPPLELLFTVSEEIGLQGASNLEPGLMQGRMLINLDSEEEGAFLVGCAGGMGTNITLNVATSGLPQGWQPYSLEVTGLMGGHSGADIHKQRGNAIQILARVLDQFQRRCPLRLISIEGGTAHNAIPRSAQAIFAAPEGNGADLAQVVVVIEETLRAELANIDPGISIQLAEAKSGEQPAVEEEDSRKIIWLLLGLPHGVAAMSVELEGLVETSNNLAQVRYKPGRLSVATSQRSSVTSRIVALTERIEAVAHLAGAQVESSEPYPAWQPKLSSPLLRTSRDVYRQALGKEPEVKAIHAGLECGVIGSRVPGMDMISLGPTIQNPHSPSEQLNIPSVEHTWQFLAAFLNHLS
jgi:dipeptidase D